MNRTLSMIRFGSLFATTAAVSVLGAIWIQQAVEMHATGGQLAELENSARKLQAQIVELRSSTGKIRHACNERLTEQKRARSGLSADEQREKNIWLVVRMLLAKRGYTQARAGDEGSSASEGELYISKYSGNFICPELLADPLYAKKAKIWWKYQVCEKSPMGIYAKSVLNAVARSELLDVLVEQDFQNMELGMLSSQAGIDRTAASLRDERVRLHHESDMQIRKLLGEERYFEFIKHHGLPQTNELAEQLESRLSYTDEPLSVEQIELLRTARPHDLDGMDDDFDEKWVDAVAAQAVGWLTPNQYAELQKLRADQKAYAKVYGSWTGRGL